MDLETQRKQNKEKRQRLAGTQWTLGTFAVDYKRTSDMPVHHTDRERIQAERDNAKVLKKALQKTQIIIGDDEDYE